MRRSCQSTPFPWTVDALRFKGKGKGKSKHHKEKGKANREKGAHSKSPDPKEMECYFCCKTGHKKSDCLRRKADLEKVKAEGRPACFLKLSMRFMKSATRLLRLGTRCALPAGRRASRYIWVLSAASMRNKHFPKGIMLDSDAAVSVCPVDYLSELASSRAGASSCGRPTDPQSGTTPAGDLDVRVIFLYSVVVISPCRVDNVYWLFGLEGLGRAKRDLVVDRVCGLVEFELEHQQVRRPE